MKSIKGEIYTVKLVYKYHPIGTSKIWSMYTGTVVFVCRFNNMENISEDL